MSDELKAQDCELEYWNQQAEDYAQVQIPCEDLRAIINRAWEAPAFNSALTAAEAERNRAQLACQQIAERLTASEARAEAAEARVGELSEALRWYADETNYIEIALPLDLSQETRTQPPKIGADCGRRAQVALSGKPVRMTPTEAADARRVQEVVPKLIDQLRADASKMSPGPERVHVLAASNWLDSLLLRLATHNLKGTPDGR